MADLRLKEAVEGLLEDTKGDSASNNFAINKEGGGAIDAD